MTLAFLETHKAVFKMHDPKGELVLDRIDRASDGSSHVRFVHKVNGLPVHGGVWIAHFDNASRLTSMSGSYAVDAHAVGTIPTLTADAAAQAAKSDAAAKNPSVPASAFTASAATLEILPVRGSPPVLAYVVKVDARTATKRVALTLHVDAKTGAVRLVVNGIQRGTASGKPPQTYAPYNIAASDISFVVSDTEPKTLAAKGPGDVDMQVMRIDGATGAVSTPIAATTAEPWTDATTPGGAAIAAQAYGQIVLAYYLEHEKDGAPLRSFDGNGTVFKAIINDNAAGIENAFWDNSDNTMHYGDGDPANLVWPMSGSLDTVAHEITHGVTSSTSGLEYIDGQDSAGINESMSDVFAALITHRIRNDDGQDFTFSEDDNNAGTPVRSMIQPTSSATREGGGYSDLQTLQSSTRESHLDSNLPSHAFYLLTHGGTHEITHYKVPCGIGWAAADRLYWRLQTQHLTPGETFRSLAFEGIAAARTLGINDKPIACAWVAVGVLTEDEAKNDWNAICEKEIPEGGAEGGDSGNILVVAPAALVECSVSLTGPGATLTP